MSRARPWKSLLQPFSKTHGLQRAGLQRARSAEICAHQAEAVRVQLEHVHAVMISRTGRNNGSSRCATPLAHDPLAVRPQIGLRGLALDLVAQGVLLAVGARNVVVVEGEQRPRCSSVPPIRTGSARRYRLTPQALNAVISFCLLSTPKFTSTATSTLIGSVRRSAPA